MVNDDMRAEPASRAPDADVPLTRPWRRTYLLFRACAWLVALVVAGFFLIGLGDGSISSFNAGLWSMLLAVTFASLWGGHALHARGRTGLATLVLAVLAVPGILATLFILLILVTQPRWN